MITEIKYSTHEEWRSVAGFEGLYEVSNTGRVRSLDRTELVFSPRTNAFKRTRKGRELKQYVDRYGYMKVVLLKDGKPNYFTVHRLVATAFVEKDEQRNTVNHIDCNTQNNNADNLCWVTNRENIDYSHNLGRQRLNAVPIVATSPKGETHRFTSQHEAARVIGVRQSAVSRALCGAKRKLNGWEIGYDN